LQYHEGNQLVETNMKTLIAAAIAAAFLAGCDSGDQSAASGKQAPTTASGGASGASPQPGPAGDTSAAPPPPPAGSGSGETKPDPGDANDHSNPQHDSKKGSSG
jgi:hypothetical protein